MPYQDSIHRVKIQRRAHKAAVALANDQPESAPEKTQRQNPNVMNITGESIPGLELLETMTT